MWTAAYCSFGQLLDPVFQRPRRFPMDREFGRLSIIGQAEAEVFAFPWASHGALFLVHLQTQVFDDEPTYASHHPFSHPLAADVNNAVVSVADELQVAVLEFLVQFVQYDVREQC